MNFIPGTISNSTVNHSQIVNLTQNLMNNSLSTTAESENIAAAFIIFFIALVSLAGNGLVLLSYLLCPQLRNQPGNWLIFNLALSDIMSTIYLQIPSIFHLANLKWDLGDIACLIHAGIAWMIMTASNWTLAAISADRAIAVNRPFQHRNCVTTFRVRFLLLFTWIISLTLSICLITRRTVSYNDLEIICTPKWTYDNAGLAWIAVIFCLLIPAAVILSSNITIIYAVRHLKSVIAHHSPEASGQESPPFSVKDSTKTLRSLYVLVIVYFFCVLPYFVQKFSFVTREKGLLPPSMAVLVMIAMFLASAINPFIYAILRKDLRGAFKKSIQVSKESIRNFGKRQKNATNNFRIRVVQSLRCTD